MATSQRIGAVALLLVLSASACTQDEPRATPPATSPAPSRSPQQQNEPTATLRLRLFASGRIIDVADGNETIVARWPRRTAPYTPPVETRHGFVGLARGPRRLDLWLVDADTRERLATDVSQGFAVSAGARFIAYGLPVYRAGSYHTQLKIASLPQGRILHTAKVANYAEPVGFIGERVLVGIGDAVANVALWNPTTGEMRPFRRYGRAAATDPISRRALLYQGDGPCWEIGNWADSFIVVRRPSCSLSQPAFSPEARWIAGIDDALAAPSRLRVFETFDAEPYHRSAPVPGAFQIAWEDEYTALVSALCCGASFRETRDRAGQVYRCHTDDVRDSECVAVWSGSARGRYSTWVVPRAPRALTIRRDQGQGFAMWPEHRGVDARDACADPPQWRSDPHAVAEEFGRQVLGWSNAGAHIDSYGHQATHALLQRGHEPLIQVWLNLVGEDCWSVTGVARRADRRPEGVSASVRGRRIQVGVLQLGAVSADVIVGFNGREIRRQGEGSGATFRLDFKPRGSGYFLVLLRDEDGQVFSAAGALLYPGLVAG